MHRLHIEEFLKKIEDIVDKQGNKNIHGDELRLAYIGVVGDRNFYSIIDIVYNPDDNRFEIIVEEDE